MNARNYLNHMIAMVIAYGLVLIAPLICDFVFDTYLEIAVIAWCNIGLFVMRLRKMPFPVPDTSRIDIVGGLKVLWWAIFWPNYLRWR